MGLRVNTNITAITAQRNLALADARLFRSVQRLSSGLRINSAGDDPAGLAISEQLRAQIAGLNAAIMNTERAVNLVQTIEGALNEINSLLIGMRELALDAANSGINNATSLAADQAEIANAIQTITRISDTSTFSIQNLLDGTFENTVTLTSLNTIGLTNLANSTLQTGSYTINVSNITASSATITSDPFNLLDNVALGDPDGLAGGSHLVVVSEATGAYVTSSSAAVLDGGSTLPGVVMTISSAATTNVVTFEGDELNTVAAIVAEINAEVSSEFIAVDNGDGTYSIAINSNSTAVGADSTITVAIAGGAENNFGFAAASVSDANGMNVGVQLDDGDMVYLTTTSATTGFVVTDANGGSLALTLETAFSTWNVIDGGTLNVEVTPAAFDLQLGSGPKVTFSSGETKTLSAGEDSLGNPIGTLDVSFGFFNVPVTDSSVTVSVVDNSIQFQVGPNANETVRISAQDVSADKLARGLITASNFVSLAEIDVTTVQGANDSILLIDTAIDEISSLRAKLGAFQQNTLETNLRSLRIAEENLSASESTIRDVDISMEITEFTRNQILLSAGVSVLAQANAIPQTVLQLLG
jgi:flagellin